VANQVVQIKLEESKLQDSMKPSWKNLKGAGGSTPIAEIVGHCDSWEIAPDAFGSNQVAFALSKCQVLKADSPYPYSDFTLSIKYSDSLNSGWGKFGDSVSKVLGIATDTLDVDLLKGQWLHLLRIDNVPYGTDRQTGQPITGTVWNLVEIVQEGAPVTAVHPSLQAGAIPSAAPAPVAPVAAPVAVATPTNTGSSDPQQRALELLHGKSQADYFPVALSDDILRKDPMLLNSILSNAFIAAKVASGDVTQNTDGTYSVVAMA